MLRGKARIFLRDNDDLIAQCNDEERMLIGRILNSPHPVEYTYGLVDAIDVLEADMTPAFAQFLEGWIEVVG